MTLIELKSQAYDILAQIEYLQKKLQETNQAISEEINNTQSVEEYVEIITAIPHTNPNFDGDSHFYANPLN